MRIVYPPYIILHPSVRKLQINLTNNKDSFIQNGSKIGILLTRNFLTQKISKKSKFQEKFVLKKTEKIVLRKQKKCVKQLKNNPLPKCHKITNI